MTNFKGKNNKDAGQRTPGVVATRDPEASTDGASPSLPIPSRAPSLQMHPAAR